VRRELERIAIPDEHEARERAWSLVQAAYAEREPVQRPRSRLVPILVAAAVAVAVAAAVSPPGRAVLDDVRDAVLPTRVERAEPALFSLPTGGRVLAVSDAGAWVVQRDGSRRLLGRYREASWSPHGLFVVASRRNELTTLEPDGDVRWTLARPDVSFPRWTGSRTDTDIAYLTTSRLHVVAGNGRQDVDAGGLPAAAPVAPAWRPQPEQSRVLAFVDTRGRVTAYDAGAGAVLFRTPALPGPRALSWSPNGTLAVATRNGVVVIAGRRQVARRALRGVVSVAFSPDGRTLAVLRSNEVSLLDPQLRSSRRVFAGGGRLDGLAWSPDGRWLLVGWPTADQWLFVAARRTARIRAVSNVAAQLRSQSFPRIEGWCCAP
jgi:WD40-like Beta Propeller Repeat